MLLGGQGKQMYRPWFGGCLRSQLLPRVLIEQDLLPEAGPALSTYSAVGMAQPPLFELVLFSITPALILPELFTMQERQGLDLASLDTNCTVTLAPSDTSWAGLPCCYKLHVPEAALGPAHMHEHIQR